MAKGMKNAEWGCDRRRAVALLRPASMEAVKALATSEGVSVSSWLSDLVEAALEARRLSAAAG